LSCASGLGLVDLGVGDARLLLLVRGVAQPPLGVVGEVVGQHVEDVALLDGLAHRVDVEVHVHALLAGVRVDPVRVERAEQLQCRRLRGGGERKVRQVRLLVPHPRQVGTAARLVAQHCGHLGIIVDDMTAALRLEQDGPR